LIVDSDLSKPRLLLRHWGSHQLVIPNGHLTLLSHCFAESTSLVKDLFFDFKEPSSRIGNPSKNIATVYFSR
jgi:hypothetical protein